MQNFIWALQLFAFIFFNPAQSRVLQPGIIQQHNHVNPQLGHVNPQQGHINPQQGYSVKKINIKGNTYLIEEHHRVFPNKGDIMLHVHDFSPMCIFEWRTEHPPRHVCRHQGTKQIVHPVFGNVLQHNGQLIGIFNPAHVGFYPLHLMHSSPHGK